MTIRKARTFFGCLIAGAMTLGLAGAACAQDKTAPQSPQKISTEMKATHPKVVVFVFDVTMSTRAGGVFGRERTAAAEIIRNGCVTGDRVVLESFGTNYKTVFDKVLTKSADAADLIDQIPERPEPGRGTNIRLPHHAALQLIDQAAPKPGVVVLLTDSFNDRPLETDPDYPNYVEYYSLTSLTTYPKSGENAGYERLLRSLKAGGRLTQYGIGVGIAEDGRPIERLPVGPGDSDAAAEPASAPVEIKPQGKEHPASNIPMIIIAVVLGLIALLVAGFSVMNRPVPVRLTLGEKGSPRDFRLRPGSRVALGGSIATAAAGDDSFPLAGAAQPVAFIQALRGGTQLIPNSDVPTGVTIFHNGARLEQSSPLRIGDEIRIALAATDGSGLPREHRVRYLDPKGSLI